MYFPQWFVTLIVYAAILVVGGSVFLLIAALIGEIKSGTAW